MRLRTWGGALVAALFMLSAGVPAAESACSVDDVRRDVQATLAGSIEVSSLTIRWQTSNEGPDMTRYEVWKRHGDAADRMAILPPRRLCSVLTPERVVVPYDADGTYYVEIHAIDGSLRAVPVTVIH